MKNRNILLTMALGLISFAAQSQVPNSGFEDLDSAGKIRHWTTTTLLAIAIDSNGNADSFVVDQGLYFATNDAHSGQTAMEMRNAYDFTANEGFAGGATATTNDSEYAFFESLIPVQGTPTAFSFYCKYFPLNSEFALGRMDVFNDNGDLLGNATAVVAGVAPVYSLVSASVVYGQSGIPSFVTISFRTCIPGQSPAFGTRFLVDDVSLTLDPTGIHGLSQDAVKMDCFPAVITDELSIMLSGIRTAAPMQLRIVDVGGRLVISEKLLAAPGQVIRVPVAGLSSGVYFVQVFDGTSRLSGKFIK